MQVLKKEEGSFCPGHRGTQKKRVGKNVKGV
jgi:hypothetical protein